MTFALELDYVDSGWGFAANAPDAVGVTLRGAGHSCTLTDWLFRYFQLYEALACQVERTNTSYAVVEVGAGIHIVHTPLRGQRTIYQTTYPDALDEVTAFLRAVFEQLEDTSGSGEREVAVEWFNDWLLKMTADEIYAQVCEQ